MCRAAVVGVQISMANDVTKLPLPGSKLLCSSAGCRAVHMLQHSRASYLYNISAPQPDSPGATLASGMLSSKLPKLFSGKGMVAMFLHRKGRDALHAWAVQTCVHGR
jgi:hypothetical protein